MLKIQARVVEGPLQKGDVEATGRVQFVTLMCTTPDDTSKFFIAQCNANLNGFFNSLGDNVPEDFDTQDVEFLDSLQGLEFGLEFYWKKSEEGEPDFKIKEFFSVV